MKGFRLGHYMGKPWVSQGQWSKWRNLWLYIREAHRTDTFRDIEEQEVGTWWLLWFRGQPGLKNASEALDFSGPCPYPRFCWFLPRSDDRSTSLPAGRKGNAWVSGRCHFMRSVFLDICSKEVDFSSLHSILLFLLTKQTLSISWLFLGSCLS